MTGNNQAHWKDCEDLSFVPAARLVPSDRNDYDDILE